jgi:hypothetical protein
MDHCIDRIWAVIERIRSSAFWIQLIDWLCILDN